MPKATPNPCNPENCGDNYPRCGKAGTYTYWKCRCDSCRAASMEKIRLWREANPGKHAATVRKWRQANPERHAENQRRSIESRRLWRESNPEEVKESERRYRELNRETISERNRQRPLDVKERRRAANRRFYAENREYARRKGHKRRALEVNAFVEDVDRIVVFDRDNWTCQICGIVCPKDAVFLAPDFATLDHIVALSRGGEHSYANSQTLCFVCNNRKGPR